MGVASQAKLLAEHPDGDGYKLIVTAIADFFIGRTTDRQTGEVVDMLTIDESDTVTATQIKATVACDVVYSGGVTQRYVREGAPSPLGNSRRWLVPMRLSLSDVTAIAS
jgi:hypothetical protein